MSVTVEKIKIVKATDAKSAVQSSEVKADATVNAVEAKPSIIERLEATLTKLLGSYDEKYQKDEVPGVPGTKPEAKPEAKKDGNYQKTEKADEDDGDDEDTDEEICPHCKQVIPAKVEAKVEAKPDKTEAKPVKAEVKKDEAQAKAEKVEVQAVEAKEDRAVTWNSLIFTNPSVKPSPRMVEWSNVCQALASNDSIKTNQE